MVDTKRHKLILLALLTWVSAASAQQTNNYAFVSPNTRENLKIADAIKEEFSRGNAVTDEGDQSQLCGQIEDTHVEGVGRME